MFSTCDWTSPPELSSWSNWISRSPFDADSLGLKSNQLRFLKCIFLHAVCNFSPFSPSVNFYWGPTMCPVLSLGPGVELGAKSSLLSWSLWSHGGERWVKQIITLQHVKFQAWKCLKERNIGLRKHRQANLGNIAGSGPDHCSKANIAIKQVTWVFGFPVHIKVLFTLCCSLLSMQ